jgi:hypothetical protein
MDYEELGRRLVACKHFRPMRGMRDMQGRTWDESLLWRWESRCDVPDLTDPATLGCLLALVREAWVCPTIYVEHEHVGLVRCDPRRPYHVVCGDGTQINGIWRSEAEALVAALEAAPDIERGEHRREEEEK